MPTVAIQKMGQEAFEVLDATHVRLPRSRRKQLYFAGSNYLGLSFHPMVLSAIRRELGAGFLHLGASRVTTGERKRYLECESALATFLKMPCARLVSSGYLAPIVAVQALRGKFDVVFLESSAHRCLGDAVQLAGVPIQRFQAGHVRELRHRMEAIGKWLRPLVVCDGVRGAIGGLAPLDEYHRLLPKNGWMIVDDAHGIGTVGASGRGTLEYFGLSSPRILLTISLSKALGVSGGAVLGSEFVLKEVASKSSAFAGSTAPPIPMVAGVMAALRILQESGDRVRKLQRNLSAVWNQLPKHLELLGDGRTPMFSIVPGTPLRRKRISNALEEAEIFPPWIQYLDGPRAGYFRFALMSEHRLSEVDRLAKAIQKGLS